jgi:hypothetical protein
MPENIIGSERGTNSRSEPFSRDLNRESAPTAVTNLEQRRRKGKKKQLQFAFSSL